MKPPTAPSAIGLALLSACAADFPDKPEAPDMSALVAAYDAPTATFDRASAEAVVADLEARLDEVERLGGLGDVIADVVAPALDAIAEQRGEDDDDYDDDDGGAARASGERPAPSATVDGEGFVRIAYVCRGFGDPAPAIDAAANGALEFVVGFTERGVDPVAWATVDRCELVVRQREILLDGELALYLGEDVQFAEVGERPVLVSLSAAVEVGGEPIGDGELDFRVCPPEATGCPPGELEVLLELAGGETVVFFVDPDRAAGGFRAANGTWTCAFAEGAATCQGPEGEPIVLDLDPDPEAP